MSFDYHRLSTPGIYFYIVDLVQKDGQMTLVQLIEKLCLENDVIDSEERRRLYHKCRRVVLQLQHSKRLHVTTISKTGKGNKKLIIKCLT